MSVFGQESPGGSSTLMNEDYIRAGKFTLSEAGDVSKLSAYMANPNASNQALRGLIYAADGESNAPYTYKGITNEVTLNASTAAGWVDFAFASPVSLAAGDYYLGVYGGATGSQARLYYAATGAYYYMEAAYPTPPSPWAGGSGPLNYALSINATYTPAASGKPTHFCHYASLRR